MEEMLQAKCGVCHGHGTTTDIRRNVPCAACAGKGKLTAEPKMAGNIAINGDHYPISVTRVSSSRRTIWFKRDRILGASLFEPNDNEKEVQATMKKDGVYRTARGIYTVLLGERRFHLVREF